MRTTLWRYHLGGGCVLALAYAYLPSPALRVGSLVALCLATIVATLASVRLWRPARRLPLHLELEIVRLNELKRLGVHLAIDDFGTGYSSLGCHLAQGYHFSRPLPAADMARLARRPAAGQQPVAGLLHPA